MIKVIAIVPPHKKKDILNLFNVTLQETKLLSKNCQHQILICNEYEMNNNNREEFMTLVCQPVQICNVQIFTNDYIEKTNEDHWEYISTIDNINLYVKTEEFASILPFLVSYEHV